MVCDGLVEANEYVDVAVSVFENAVCDGEESSSDSIGVSRSDELSVHGDKNDIDAANGTGEREGAGWVCTRVGNNRRAGGTATWS